MDLQTVRQWFYRRWGWVVVVATFLLNFVLYGLLYTYGILFDALQEEFNSTATITGWIGSIAIAMTVLFAPVYRILIERFGYRRTAVAGVFLVAIGTITTSFLPILPPMYLTYSLFAGLGAGLLCVSSFSLILCYFPTENCVRANSIALAGAGIGMLSFAPILYIIRNRLGWRALLQIMGSVIFAVGLPCVLTFADPSNKTNSSDTTPINTDESGVQNDMGPAKKCPQLQAKDETRPITDTESGAVLPSHVNGDCNKVSEIHPSKISSKVSSEGNGDEFTVEIRHSTNHGFPQIKMLQRLKTAATFPELWLVCIIVTNNGAITSFYYVNMVNYMTSVGFTVENGVRIISIMGISELVGKIVLILAGDYLPFPRIFQQLIVSFVSCIFVGCLLIVRTMGPMIGITIVLGFILALSNVLPFTVSSEVFGPERAQETWAIVNCSVGVGFIVGSLFGQSVDRTGSYDGAIYAVMGLYMVSAILAILVPVYQRLFAKDRFVMMELFRRKRSSHNEGKTGEIQCFLDPPKPENIVIADRVTSV